MQLLAFSSHADWEPSFVDNFEGERLNPQAWVPGRENLARRIHHFSEDALEVSDGRLRISVLDKPQSERAYASGVVTTQGVFKQRYGYFEMRARIPAGQGFWPSFWLMPESGLWTSEIDIAELRGHLSDTVHYALHYGNRLRNEHSADRELPLDLASSFNNYAVYWSPQRIDYLLNDFVLHSITDPQAVANASDEMFLVLNLALSSQHSAWVPTVNADTDLSQAFEIDYVRVYREVSQGRYDRIPSPNTNVPNLLPSSAYDHTAVSVERVKGSNDTDIVREEGQISGALQARSHRSNYRGRLSLFLSQMQNYNEQTGRFDKSAVLEALNFDIELNTIGDTQRIEYQFQTPMQAPGTYIVDALIRDPQSGNKKNLWLHRTVQYLDQSRSDALSANAYFRQGSARIQNGELLASAVLQVQEALQLPSVRLQYQVFDLDSGEELGRHEQTLQHQRLGEQLLELSLPVQNLGTGRALGLLLSAHIGNDGRQLACLAVDVNSSSGTATAWAENSGHCQADTGSGSPDTGQPDTSGPVVPGGVIPTRRWHPSFVDNFDGDELNQENWVPGWDHLFRRINYYDRDALRVENGRLHIDVLQKAQSDRPYSTGIITTQGTFRQRYGYFEMRARIPSGNGFWPSFWLMPDSGRWTSEIDIAEFRGHLSDEVHHALHYGNRLRNEHSGDIHTGVDLSASMNNYAVYWTPERIDYLFNGRIVHSVTDPGAVGQANDRMFMILDLALSSDHASNWIPVIDADTNIQQSFEVDYVRVFHLNPYGSYLGIPAADEYLPDQRFPTAAAYDQTALSAKRLYAPFEGDILYFDWPISGQFELTSHRANYDGLVTVAVTQLSDFDNLTGRYSKSASLASRNYFLQMDNIGDRQRLDYAFDLALQRPGIYSVDLLIKDPNTNAKSSLSSQRVIQYIDPEQSDSSVFLQGFVRSGQASYEASGRVSTEISLQLQQALLVPHLQIDYSIRDSVTGQVVASSQQQQRIGRVGLLDIRHNFAATLSNARSYTLTVDISDPENRLQLPTFSRAVQMP